jgi:hypothetical protein
MNKLLHLGLCGLLLCGASACSGVFAVSARVPKRDIV